MKPSTTVRARSSRLSIRPRILGSTKRADGDGSALSRCPLMVVSSSLLSSPLHSGLGHRNGLQEPINDLARADALRIGVEVREDAVAENRMGQAAYVLEAHVVPPLHQRPGLATQDKVLGGADAGTILHPLLDEVGGVGLSGAADAGQAHRIAHDRPRDRAPS